MMHRTQSGNIFFALFGAVGLVAVLGAATMTIMKGPVRSMAEVTKRTVAENAMIAAGRLALSASTQGVDGGDCDGDGYVEPIEWSETGTGIAPVGGGFLPPTIGAARQDPWGTTYGYCAWDHGATVDDAACGGAAQLRLAGEESENYVAIAVISAGANRAFETSCADTPDYLTRVGGSDDVILEYTYGESSAMGLWRLKSGDPDTAEIGARDIEIAGSGGADVARIGYDADLDMSGVGDFLAIKTDSIYSKTPSGTVGMYAPLRVQNVTSLGAPATGGGGFAALQCTGDEIPVWDDDLTRWVCGEGDTLGGLACGANEVPKWNGSAWACASDTTIWSLNGAKAYYNGGNVGIGTNDPLMKLDVRGQMRMESSPGVYDLWIQGGTSTATNNERNLAILGIIATDKLYINHSSEYTGGTEIGGPVTLTDKVGIGTSDPQDKLHIVGALRVNGGSSTQWSHLGWNRGLIMPQAHNILWEYSGSGQARSIGASSNGIFYIARAPGNDASATGAYDMIINNSGQVGIGTTPSELLHIKSASNAGIRLESGGALGSRIEHYNGATGGGGINIFPASDSRVFNIVGSDFSNANAPVTVLRNGRVGIGTTTPSTVFQLDAVTPVMTLRDTSNSGDSAISYIRFVGANDTRTGYVGDASASNGHIYIRSDNGDIWATGTGGACYVNTGGCASDIRLKQDIQPIEGALDKLVKLSGVSYEWKKNPGEHYMGFIAQEVEKQFPILVKTDEDGTKSVNYNGITAPIVEAIKELKTLFDELVEKVAQLFDVTAELKAENAALTARIEALEARNAGAMP